MKREAIERLLPTMYQLSATPGGPLDALLRVMADLHEPDDRLLDDVDAVFDPYRTLAEFVPWLSQWLGLEWLVAQDAAPVRTAGTTAAGAFPPGMGRLRDLVAVGATLAQWRGTETGMRLFLSTATGTPGFTVAEPADHPFHLVVSIPPEAVAHIALIRRIVDHEKPAYMTAELRLPAPTGPGGEDGGDPTDGQEGAH